MKLLWNRLELWLEKEAPDVLDDLRPGASESEIAELESALGTALSADLKESLMIHNGQSGESRWLIAGWELLSTERILAEWTIWKDLYDQGAFADWSADSQDGITNLWWQPEWIPLTYNGCGDHHCLDMSPSGGKNKGQMISMWHDSSERRILAASYRQWFEHLVRTFEAGGAEYVFDSGEFEFDANESAG